MAAGIAGLAHLIGSVPLESAESVFTTVLGALGHCLRRVPDGERGEHRRWIYWQRTMLERHPAMVMTTRRETVDASTRRVRWSRPSASPPSAAGAGATPAGSRVFSRATGERWRT